MQLWVGAIRQRTHLWDRCVQSAHLRLCSQLWLPKTGQKNKPNCDKISPHSAPCVFSLAALPTCKSSSAYSGLCFLHHTLLDYYWCGVALNIANVMLFIYFWASLDIKIFISLKLSLQKNQTFDFDLSTCLRAHSLVLWGHPSRLGYIFTQKPVHDERVKCESGSRQRVDVVCAPARWMYIRNHQCYTLNKGENRAKLGRKHQRE